MLNHIKNLYKGRLGRLDYFITGILTIPLIAIPFTMFTLWFISDEVDTNFPETTLVFFGTLGSVLLPISIYSIILLFGIITRRSHDTNSSGFFGLVIYVLGQLFLFPHLFLLFAKDKRPENYYGSIKQGNFLHRVFNLK